MRASLEVADIFRIADPAYRTTHARHLVLDLVFANGQGNVEQLNYIVRRGLQPVQIAAGVTIATDQVNDEGKAVLAAKYSGMHAAPLLCVLVHQPSSGRRPRPPAQGGTGAARA